MRHIKAQFIATLVSLGIVALLIASDIILFSIGIFVDNRTTATIYGVVVPVAIAIWMVITFFYLTNRNFYKTNMIENKYNFGKERSFFNYMSFEREIKWKKHFKRGLQYIISFTATDYNTMRNTSRNDAIMLYSNEIATSLTKIIRDEKTPYKP